MPFRGGGHDRWRDRRQKRRSHRHDRNRAPARFRGCSGRRESTWNAPLPFILIKVEKTVAEGAGCRRFGSIADRTRTLFG